MRSRAIDRSNDSLAEKAAFAIGKVVGLSIVFLIAVMAAIVILAGLVQIILWVKPSITIEQVGLVTHPLPGMEITKVSPVE